MEMCRCCLVLLPQNQKYHNLLSEFQLAIKLTNLMNDFLLNGEDIFPKNICEQCYENVLKCYDFQKMCEESMVNYKNFFNEQMELLHLDNKSEEDEKNDKDAQNNIEEEAVKTNDNRTTMDNTVTTSTAVEEEAFEKLEEVYILNISEDDELKAEDEISEAQNETKEEEQQQVINDDDNNELQTTKESNDKNLLNLERFYYCKLCPKWFYKEDRLQAHIRTHQGLKPYVCSICARQFERYSNLCNHINEIHMKISYRCNFNGCHNIYTAERSLRKHISECHVSRKARANINSNGSGSSAEKECGKQQICEVCGKIFKRRSTLSRHRYVHMDKSKYPFACEHCGRRFYTKQFLRDHLNRHAGINNFTCTICDKTKPTKAALNAHMKRHINKASSSLSSSSSSSSKACTE